jgi:hypothetical protein
MVSATVIPGCLLYACTIHSELLSKNHISSPSRVIFFPTYIYIFHHLHCIRTRFALILLSFAYFLPFFVFLNLSSFFLADILSPFFLPSFSIPPPPNCIRRYPREDFFKILPLKTAVPLGYVKSSFFYIYLQCNSLESCRFQSGFLA